jgi:geranylgeranyl pyrophosphate synthase
LGKPAGHDLTQGTVTLPTIIYASGLSEPSTAYQRLRDVVAGDVIDPAEVHRVVRDIRRSGALQAAMAEAEHFATRAKAHAAAAPDLETRAMMEEVADIVCARSS